MMYRSLSLMLPCVVFAAALQACASNSPRNPAPPEAFDRAVALPGVPAVRAWAGRYSEAFLDDLLLSVRQARDHAGEGGQPPNSILILSGGADKGPFGAGFLNGWSDAGTRPEFRVVTGVSAGALIAPFAFLGSSYDDELKSAFYDRRQDDIFRARPVSGLFGDSLANADPLERLIAHYFDRAFLSDVALAHESGRRLYVATTNLDADRLVVWNLGAIAASGHPLAPYLFRDVVLASASVPGIFPPVLIEVDVEGHPHDEMHVDGGVKAQLFLAPASLDLERLQEEIRRVEGGGPPSDMYVIRNSEIGPEPEIVPRELSRISMRAFDSLVKAQARGDLVRVYETARRQGQDFHWIAIPHWFEPSGRFFDTDEMNHLYDIGYDLGLERDPWRRRPPGFDQR